MFYKQLKLKMKFKDELPQSICPKCALWNNNKIQHKKKQQQQNLHMKGWINKGIFTVKDITSNRSQILSFEEVERTVGRALHRLFEYIAAKTALEQARERGKLRIKDHEDHEFTHTVINNILKKTSVLNGKRVSNTFNRGSTAMCHQLLEKTSSTH